MGELRFIVYDVQHGSCSHIITPANQHIIIDLGSKTETSICQYLKENYFCFGGTIDQLVLTHLHEDHIYDLPNLDTYGINPRIFQRPRRAFPLSYKASDPNHYKNIVNKANQLNEHYTGVVSASESPVLSQNNGGVHFKFFSPPDDLCSDDPNSFSNIIVVSYGYFKIVITGDNPASILKEMLQNNIQLRQSITDSTILVAPHHGRDGEYCEEFVSAVNPCLTVFSDGTKNSRLFSKQIRKRDAWCDMGRSTQVCIYNEVRWHNQIFFQFRRNMEHNHRQVFLLAGGKYGILT